MFFLHYQHTYQVRLFESFVVVHTSRSLTGSPLAVPSRGPHGIPQLVVTITLDCRCICREFAFAVDCSGNCRRLTCQLPSIAVEIAVATTADCRGVQNLPWQLRWMAAECRGLPSKLPWQFVVVCRENYSCVNCRGNCHGNRHGMPWFAV